MGFTYQIPISVGDTMNVDHGSCGFGRCHLRPRVIESPSFGRWEGVSESKNVQSMDAEPFL